MHHVLLCSPKDLHVQHILTQDTSREKNIYIYKTWVIYEEIKISFGVIKIKM
jgi:hypothetical protein